MKLVCLGYTSGWGNWGTLNTPDGYTFIGFTAPQTNGYHFSADINFDGSSVKVNVSNGSQQHAVIRVIFKAIFVKTGIVS
jgi:hypothetical protein